ncbi:hypothetical protein [Spirosoma luteum]|uniref:hypothetical protein n=1 Tax=Spirosoma luteum TaxID=431553 RepID=UPI0003674A7C|nr:hypothetical protein [Spirosoma luteum]
MTTTPPRTLSGLTESEAAECFRLAFGTRSRDAKEIQHRYTNDRLFITGEMHRPYLLEIHPFGMILAYQYDKEEMQQRYQYINHASIVRYLESLGIAWE